MVVKLINLILFLSLIILCYLTLGKKNAKAGLWLTVVTGVWLILLIAYLPIFHLVQLSRLKSFLSISGIVLSLVLVHYFGRLMMWAIDRLSLSEHIKRFFERYIALVFNTVIFWFYFLTFLLASILALQK